LKDKSEKDELVEIGIDLLNDDKINEAIEYFDKALEIDPKNIIAILSKADALQKLHHYDESLQYFDKALEIDPKNMEILKNKGFLLQRIGGAKQAIKYFDKALEIDPKNMEILKNKSFAYSELENFEEAIKSLDIVLAEDPNDGYALLNKGINLIYLSKLDEALQYFDKAIQNNPNDVMAYLSKGQIFFYVGKYEKALESVDKALEIDPKNVYVTIIKGNTLQKLGRYDESLQFFDKALEIEPNDTDALSGKGNTLQKLGRYDESLQFFDKALEINPRNTDALSGKGNTLQKLGRYDESLQFFDKALEIEPNDIDVLTSKGIILQLMGKEKDAISYLEKARNAKAKLKPIPKLTSIDVHESNNFVEDLQDIKSSLKRNQFIPTFRDHPSLEDKLFRKPLANILSEIIISLKEVKDKNKDEGPYVINIHGPWGSGKTTLINFIEEEIRFLRSDWVIVKFNAWQYQRLNAPPWWMVMDKIFAQAVTDEKSKTRSFTLKLKEYSWRLLTGKSHLTLWIFLFFIFVAISLFFLFQSDILIGNDVPITNTTVNTVSNNLNGTTTINTLTNMKFLDLLNNIGGIVALAGTLISGISIIRNSLVPSSIQNTKEIIEKSKDPAKEFNKHFKNLVKNISKPILVTIDDLDRCKENYVVEFLEGIFTIFSNANVFYIIAADQRWLQASYEKVYENFTKLKDEYERPLGYTFMEKIFQLVVPLPKLSKKSQKEYFDYLLYETTDSDGINEELEMKAKNILAKQDDPDEIVKITEKERSADPLFDRVLRVQMVKRLSQKDIQTKTEHFLQPFIYYVDPNPRAAKRFLNIFNITRAITILSGGDIDNKKLAIWTILALRWPEMARYLLQNPDEVSKIGKAESSNLPVSDTLKALFQNKTIVGIVNGTLFNTSLNEDWIRKVSTWPI
jgi:superkiller protein 3